MVYLILANGFEDIEAFSTIDILRRGGVQLKTLSLHNNHAISAHGIEVKTDGNIADFSTLDCDMLIFPGGPGTVNLESSMEIRDLLDTYQEQYNIAAICAAPRLLGKHGLLKGKRATCYPGNDTYLEGATYVEETVVVDLPFITANGPGSSMDFALTLVSILKNPMTAETIRGHLLL